MKITGKSTLYCSLILLALMIRVEGAQVSGDIESHGTVSYYREGTGTLRVDGTEIIDGSGREVRLKGFNLWGNDIYGNHMPLTVERFEEIKEWGFNVVRDTGWWGWHFEPFQNQAGVYHEENLARVEQAIIASGNAGLYYILSVRISYQDNNPPYWQGWGRHSYMLQERYLNRFCRFWEMLIRRFEKYENVVGYCPWHFPWHRTPINETIRTYYNRIITPRLVNTIRAFSDKIIFWAPIQCQPKELQVLSDKNAVYMHEHYRPHSVTHESQSWNYDVQGLRQYILPSVNFANEYSVPMIITEFGIRSYVDQTHLDYLNAQLSLFEEYGYSWLYFFYTKGVGFAVLNSDGTATPIVDVLLRYNKTLYG